MSDSMFNGKEEEDDDDDDEEEPPLSEELRRKIELEDPGIDLSVFKPLGKRKCVIEMEERKGKTWYEGDDDASEEEVQQETCKFKHLVFICKLVRCYLCYRM